MSAPNTPLPQHPSLSAAPAEGDDEGATQIHNPDLTFSAAEKLEVGPTAASVPPAPTPAPPQPDDMDSDTMIMPGYDATLVLRPRPTPEPVSHEVQEPAALPEDEQTRVIGADDVSPTLAAAVAAAQAAARTPPQPVQPAQSAESAESTAAPATAAPAQAAEPAGQATQPRQVGRYRLLERLGRGGMASVYRAHDPSIGRDVAIKFLHRTLCEDEDCRSRFLREARAAGALSHPNIVVVHDVGEIDDQPYMAMELLEGQSLAERLDSKEPLSIRQVLALGIQLARALDYAHANGVVHRDIKPGNIMLQGKDRRVKVADFGIAHVEGAGAHQQTMVGSILGTPQYMSPEQTRGEKLDGRSDLFSAGVVLYQALTGHRPFRGDNLVAVAQQIAAAEPPAITSLRPDCPPALRRVVERCLAKAPAQRFATGAELEQALRKVLTELAEQEQGKQRSGLLSLRVKWAGMMALVVAAVMGLTTVFIAQRQYQALETQASGYGASLARFMAAQNAAAVLGEEWDLVEIAVQETMRTRNFERITVIDSNGQVRASSIAGLAGLPYEAPPGEDLAELPGGVVSNRYNTASGTVLGFEAPVSFGGRQVGRLALSIVEKPLTEVARLSVMLMGVLALVTVLAVGVATFFLVNWFSRPIKLMIDSMGELAKGNLTHRIAESRKDEFGQLYAAFDALAVALQRRDSPEPPTSPSLSLTVASADMKGTPAVPLQSAPDAPPAAQP
ncbi:MAG: HAMP domain-containing protein [Rubrivivax sp.]|nr:MAG: HAMP domain-containing protein [Rubrivivax sp.]